MGSFNKSNLRLLGWMSHYCEDLVSYNLLYGLFVDIVPDGNHCDAT